MNAIEIMTRVPVTVSPAHTVGEVLGLLYEREVRHIPVVDEDRLVGMISDRDLRVLLGPRFELGMGGSSVLDKPIGPLMSSDLRYVDPETDVSEIIEIMLENKVGAVPVANADGQDLVGIVSYVDILRAAQDLF
jgi:acetoin utilization protein AcuB